MKTVFILNPAAGKGVGTKELENRIKSAAAEAKADFEIYTTKTVGDAERFVALYPQTDKKLRFVACGGDGTLSEVLTGSMGRDACEIGVIPVGTGNDFCRNFHKSKIKEIFSGKTVRCDAIRCTLINPTGCKEIYSANMINIGFDCNAADLCSRLKKKPFISGTLAYVLSVFVMLVKKRGACLVIDAGEEIHRGELLLSTFANGCFCGGGFMSNPLASVTDGKMNVNIIKNLSRLKFISLLSSYKNGTFIKKKGIEKFLTSASFSAVRIKAVNGSERVCIDGEIHSASEIVLEVVPAAFSFIGQRK